MTDEVTQLPSSPRKDTPSPEVRPLADDLPSIERETNTISQDEMDHLRELFFFPSNIQIKLLDVDKTTVSTRLGEVAIYEAVFHAGLCFPLHPIIRKIL